MKLKKNEIAILNDSNVDIKDYPIEDAETDEMGNALIDSDTQAWRTTGTTNTWDIEAGETKIFPRYVGRYMMGIYEFLEEVEVPEDAVVEDEEVEELEGEDGNVIRCKYCKETFKNTTGVAMHMAHKHPEAFR